MRVPYPDLLSALTQACQNLGIPKADLCAQLFAETTLDGVYTHGLNRFPRFRHMVQTAAIDSHAFAQPVTPLYGHALAMERWDGHRGPGNINAHLSMARAIDLARVSGIACIALGNTTHWMRGGSFGWQAANAGLIGICWTNTLPNMPAWGTAQPTLGNNPFVISVPRPEGHIVLDMAMSQFSYGTLASYAQQNKQLPVPGGYNRSGDLTQNPAEIEDSQRAMPIGFWKGSSFSLILDIIASTLAQGLSTHQLTPDPLQETGISQSSSPSIQPPSAEPQPSPTPSSTTSTPKRR